MTKDEQARARLVEMALEQYAIWPVNQPSVAAHARTHLRTRAGFKNPRTGSWCAAGLTAAMEDAGLVVPAPGTPARRGAVALLDWVIDHSGDNEFIRVFGGPGEQWRQVGAVLAGHDVNPGDIIAWLQNKPPAEWNAVAGVIHAYATHTSERSMCGKAPLSRAWPNEVKRCSSCVWETRKGHVALIVAVDDESITTVGWNEGAAPGRVMKRRLWRNPARDSERWMPKRSSTVLWRRPGGFYGIARPVAR